MLSNVHDPSGPASALAALETTADRAASALTGRPTLARAEAIAAVAAADRALRAVARLRPVLTLLVTTASLRDQVRVALDDALQEGDDLAAEVSALATEQRALEHRQGAIEQGRAEADALRHDIEELRRIERAAGDLEALRRVRDELTTLVGTVADDVDHVDDDIGRQARAVVAAMDGVLRSLSTRAADVLAQVEERTAQIARARAALDARRSEAEQLAAELEALAAEDDQDLALMDELHARVARAQRRADQGGAMAKAQVEAKEHSDLADRADRLTGELSELEKRLESLAEGVGTLRAEAQRRFEARRPLRLGDRRSVGGER
jgi:chromosome segregation ATPase